MAFEDDRITYGFNRADAEALAKSIGGGDTPVPERKPRGGSTSGKLYAFVLKENMGATTANQADAHLYNMTPTDTGTDVNVFDRVGIFADLEADDAGLCLLQAGEYHVIQAFCPGSGIGNLTPAPPDGSSLATTDGGDYVLSGSDYITGTTPSEV